MIDHDEAARSAGEGAKKTEREQEKLRDGRDTGHLRRRRSRYWRCCRGRSAMVRSVCTVMLVETSTSGLGSKPGLRPRPNSDRVKPMTDAQ